MAHPSDDELESMARAVERHESLHIRKKAAAMLRACKGRVRVRALKWHQNKTYGSMYDYRIYAVHQGNKYGIFSTFLERDQWGSRVQVAKCVPIEAAKAAAQADYEARILAAIERDPDHSEWNAAIEAAAKVANHYQCSDKIRALAKKGQPND